MKKRRMMFVTLTVSVVVTNANVPSRRYNAFFTKTRVIGSTITIEFFSYYRVVSSIGSFVLSKLFTLFGFNDF